MPFHEVSSNVRINYTIHNPTGAISTPKPWIILINGLADPQQSWATQIPAFTLSGYTVLTYDNCGIGLSSRPGSNEVYSAETMADDLRSLVKALNVPTPHHVLGVSMGGMIAQMYALKYCLLGGEGDGDIASLTLACTYSHPGPFCSRMFSLWKDMAQKMSLADVMRDVALWCFTPAFFADPARQGEVGAIEEEMSRTDQDMGLKAYLAQLNVITSFNMKDYVGQLGGGHIEVIVLAGEADILIPTLLSKELHESIPGSHWRTTKGGHGCGWEFPDEFNLACLEEWKQAEESIAARVKVELSGPSPS